jgi:hypothetical protein
MPEDPLYKTSGRILVLQSNVVGCGVQIAQCGYRPVSAKPSCHSFLRFSMRHYATILNSFFSTRNNFEYANFALKAFILTDIDQIGGRLPVLSDENWFPIL